MRPCNDKQAEIKGSAHSDNSSVYDNVKTESYKISSLEDDYTGVYYMCVIASEFSSYGIKPTVQYEYTQDAEVKKMNE